MFWELFSKLVFLVFPTKKKRMKLFGVFLVLVFVFAFFVPPSPQNHHNWKHPNPPPPPLTTRPTRTKTNDTSATTSHCPTTMNAPNTIHSLSKNNELSPRTISVVLVALSDTHRDWIDLPFLVLEPSRLYDGLRDGLGLHPLVPLGLYLKPRP